jgi:excinuclease UvrABC nuclease subunit
VTGAPFTTVALGEHPQDALDALPAGPGVGQLVGPEGRNLLIGRAANLRRWAASHLGQGPPPKKGKRPRTDLRGIAHAVRFAPTASDFGQRLRYERLMAEHVPLAKRKDLKTPAFLHVDTADRFPRVVVREAGGEASHLFGPFRDRAAAGRARDLLHKRFALRPCDYVFDPNPELPLGLGCVYAQVRTCAAPCLARIPEDAYRDLAAQADRFLAGPAGRADELPPWIARLQDARALVAERAKQGWELFAVREGRVVDDTACPDDGLGEALGRLAWTGAASADDLAWVSAWLHAPKRKGAWVAADGAPADLERRVRAAFEE